VIKEGTRITLRPYKDYHGQEGKENIYAGYDKDKFGNEYLKFQTIDINRGVNKPTTGFCYVNIYTDLPLKVGDSVTVDKILGVQVKGFKRTVVLWIKIKETNPRVIVDISENNFMEGFEF